MSSSMSNNPNPTPYNPAGPIADSYASDVMNAFGQGGATSDSEQDTVRFDGVPTQAIVAAPALAVPVTLADAPVSAPVAVTLDAVVPVAAHIPAAPNATVAAMPVPPKALGEVGLANGGRRFGWGAALGVAGVALLGIAGIAVGAVNAAPRPMPETIVPGVQVGGVAVGGMRAGEAREAVRVWAREQADTKNIALVAPQTKRRWLIPVSLAGGYYDVDAMLAQAVQVGAREDALTRLLKRDQPRDVTVAPIFRFDETVLEKRLADIAKKVNTTPKNARARMASGNVIAIAQREQKGVTMDVAATKAAVLKNGTESLRDGAEATLIVREVSPTVTASTIGKIGTLIGSYRTSFGSSSSSRQSNIRKAAGKIDGVLLAPGETFSYNDVVGPRYPSLGWRNAPTYQDGQVVPGPGGGICQVSTTLYNAVLRAGLKIVERSNHSMPVHYVPAGCDATVNYGSIDFKFRNNTKGPLFVDADTGGAILKFNLWAQEPDEKIAYDVVTSGRSYSRRGGFSVTSYRVAKFENGGTKRERLSSDYYRPMATESTDTRSASVPRRVRRKRRNIVRPAVPAIVRAPATAVAATSSRRTSSSRRSSSRVGTAGRGGAGLASNVL